MLELVQLEGFERRKPGELSGGQKQRVAIARAIVTNPSVILADEPTGALDSGTSRQIMELLQEINRRNNITMMIVTHEMKFARNVSSRIFGDALQDGAPVQPSFPEWKQSDEPASVRECITDII